MSHPPTPEQAAILDFVASTDRNLMIRAYAGCGKTSTLEMIDRSLDKTPKMLLCFNKAIAVEAKERMLPSTVVKTFNGLGHSIWADATGRRLSLNTKKINEIYRALIDEAPRHERQEYWAISEQVYAGVNFARALGYIPASNDKADKGLCDFAAVSRLLDETPSPEVHALIDKVLNISIVQAHQGVVDFNDQIYMPALFSGAYPTFPLVLIDEYQDLSPVNRRMVERLCRRSRQIGVGDEAQAIYGFRGADESSMPTAIEQFNMDVLPLSLTFRCPSNIVDNVKWRVPNFRAFNAGGKVETLSDFELEDNSAVICRNNAPLLAVAMKEVLKGNTVDVSGVDIGAKVIKTMEKLGSETMTQRQTISAINDWLDEKLSLDSKTARDLAGCMLEFARHGKTLSAAIAYAKHLFENSHGTIRFMTGHKAKGLEFDHVYHLEPSLLRHKDQDDNVHYVIDSRPKQTLSYITVPRPETEL
jgi:DNA helicase-2/ATP-dependent DNA helicase PcrA